MPSIFLRPSSTPTNQWTSSNPHLLIDEETASDSDYAYSSNSAAKFAYINFSGPPIVLADITGLKFRYRRAVVNASGVPTTAGTDQIISAFINGVYALEGATAPPSAWTTFTKTFTKANLDFSFPGYDWNNLQVVLQSEKAANANRTAVSWMEVQVDVSTLPAGLPLYHLINMM